MTVDLSTVEHTSTLWALDFEPEMQCTDEDGKAVALCVLTCDAHVDIPLCSVHLKRSREFAETTGQTWHCVYCKRPVIVCWSYIPIGGF